MDTMRVEITDLNNSTPDGLFITDNGVKFWVLTGPYRRRYAVQLKACNLRPAFSYSQLFEETLDKGKWLGRLTLLPGEFNRPSNRGNLGYLSLQEERVYIAVAETDGRHRDLRIIDCYGHSDWAWTRSCYKWDLVGWKGEIIFSFFPEGLINATHYRPFVCAELEVGVRA